MIGSRASRIGWLVCLLASLALPVNGDERALQVELLSGETRQFSLAELEEHTALQRVRVYDPQYEEVREYEGVPLRPLLASVGLDQSDLTLICTDGYSVALDAELLADDSLTPLIAFRDVSPSTGSNWQLYEHGRELVDFDPFYLIWKTEAGEKKADHHAHLPWPYQFTSVRRAIDEEVGKPPTSVANNISQGHELVVGHCVRCHQVQGAGGTLGPALDRQHGMVSVLDDQQLGRLIHRVNDFFPVTKMPNYENVFSSEQVESIVSYLRWVTAQPTDVVLLEVN